MIRRRGGWSAAVDHGASHMRKILMLAAGAAAMALSAGTVANATTFVGDYSATVNTVDPGLKLNVFDLPGALNFSLNNPGDTSATDIFKLYTLEGSIESDDLAPKPISVAFNFTLPDVFGGSVGGTTYGESFFGVVQNGHVQWSGPQILNFGNGGQLQVALNNADFNKGFFGLDEGKGDGATITASFQLVSNAIPEPATWAMMITGFGLAGVAIRRRRTLVAAV